MQIMKKVLFVFIAVLLCSTSLMAQKAGKTDTTKHIAYYTCPMHPEYVSHQPGTCPKCGMKLNQSSKEQMKATVMKNYTCPVHIDVFAHDPGKCPKCGKALMLSTKEQMKAEVTKLQTCPMHPDVALNKDGVCPKCGKKPAAVKNQ
jgi:transcription initiation factor IIE alpha subunit